MNRETWDALRAGPMVNLKGNYTGLLWFPETGLLWESLLGISDIDANDLERACMVALEHGLNEPDEEWSEEFRKTGKVRRL